MSTDPLSLTFAALADPTRRAILARLSQGESSVKELAEPFAMGLLPARARHRVLHGRDVVVFAVVGRGLGAVEDAPRGLAAQEAHALAAALRREAAP